MIDSIYSLIAERGGQLLLGASCILALGSLLVFLCRAPIHRQRLAELSLAALLVWLVAVLLPMPRLMDWQKRAPVEAMEAEYLDLPALVTEPPSRMPMTDPAALLAELDALQVASDRALAETAARRAERDLPPAEPEGTLVFLPPVEERFELDLGSWLVAGFMGGAGLMLLYLGMGAALLCLHLRRSQLAPTRIRSLGRRLMRQGGVDMPLRILLSQRSCRPYCLGLRRASIVIPAALADPGQEAQLSEVLRHEIGHLRQGDYRGQLLFAALLPLLFFHPLFWYLRREARLAAELIADDWAARQSDRAQYARELIALSENNHPGPAGLLPAMPVIASKNQFYRRMTMLLQRDDDLATSCSPLRRRLQLSLA
ncbi:MAG: M56 family metallopeptidase, partial [Planctomycetota bacterium]